MFASKKDDKKNRYRRRVSPPRAPSFTVHARTAERRHDMMHKTGAVVLLVAALGGLVWMLSAGVDQVKQWLFVRNERFVIRQLEISSNGKLTAEHIREFGGLTEGRNLFDYDIADIRGKLQDGPLIKHAEVERHLPDTLVVRISERIPLARIAQGQAGFFFSIDQDGHVLGLAGKQMSSMPLVKGFSDRGVSPGTVLRDGGALDALNVINLCNAPAISQLVNIQTIDVSHPDYLELLLDGSIKVLLPRNAPRSKLEDLVIFLRESGGRVTFIDLTMDRNIPAT